MTRTPFDNFSKQLLSELLSPIGEVQLSKEVAGESRLIDIYFAPATRSGAEVTDLGLLSQMAQTPCLLEPFRNAPSRTEIRNCLLKTFWVHADMQRQARRDNASLTEAELPYLWILSPTMSEEQIRDLNALTDANWLPGIYFLGSTLRTAVVAIHQLPVTQATRWVRLLGKGRTQQQAISEILELSPDDPRRLNVLKLLASWKVGLDAGEVELEEDELMAQLSQAYLEWEQRTEQRGMEQGERLLIIRQLTRKVGELPEGVRLQVEALPLVTVEALGEALLDFTSLNDLEIWLASHSV